MSTHQTVDSGRPGAEPAVTDSVAVGLGPLSFGDVVAVARQGASVRLPAGSLARIRGGREIIEVLADDDSPHYGVSTGFGALATRHIPPPLRAQLQASLI